MLGKQPRRSLQTSRRLAADSRGPSAGDLYRERQATGGVRAQDPKGGGVHAEMHRSPSPGEQQRSSW